MLHFNDTKALASAGGNASITPLSLFALNKTAGVLPGLPLTYRTLS